MILYYHKETQQSIQHGGFIMRNLEATERLRTMQMRLFVLENVTLLILQLWISTWTVFRGNNERTF